MRACARIHPFSSSSFVLIAALVACDDETGGPSSDVERDPSTHARQSRHAQSDDLVAVKVGAEDRVRAPDEHTVAIDLVSKGALSLVEHDLFVAPSLDPEDYVIVETDGEGSLGVLDVTLDAASRTVTLMTERQKLGVRYTLTVEAPGSALDGLEHDFLSADTAEFWVMDMTGAELSNDRVRARRVDIGDSCVVYVEDGQSAGDVAATVEIFDDLILPAERDLFVDPPDMDENGKIVLLGIDGDNLFSGYYSPIDSLTTEEAAAAWNLESNEMEILYLAVDDDAFEPVVVAHELSHLLYNEVHGAGGLDWPWHNEGMAECAVNAVFGNHPAIEPYIVLNPTGEIGNGVSLVHWEQGNYDQYVTSFLFLSYAAHRLGGVSAYRDLFYLSGDPMAMDQHFQSTLGAGFTAVQLGAMVATWMHEPTGPNGFGDVFVFADGFEPPSAQVGMQSLSLAPYAGTFFEIGVESVDYPGNQGPDIVYLGVNGEGAVDMEAPFDTSGGVLVVLNADHDTTDPAEQASGPFLAWAPEVPDGTRTSPPHPQAAARKTGAIRSHAWKHPPPIHPANWPAIQRWRDATR